jgi:hypothetical protein
MSDHKFGYTVSGVDLSHEQKEAISREIGAAVARVLAGGSPGVPRTDFLAIGKNYGGIWLDPNFLGADLSVPKILERAPDPNVRRAHVGALRSRAIQPRQDLPQRAR